jgi:hypothetical protein
MRALVPSLRGSAADVQAWHAALTATVQQMPMPRGAPAEAASSSAAAVEADASGTAPEAPSDVAPAAGSVGDEDDGVFRTGWLEKMGNVVKSWRRRWFVLRYGALEYYKAAEDRTPRGTILLAEGVSHLVPADKEGFEFYLEVSLAA